jgi:hypothetical protein
MGYEGEPEMTTPEPNKRADRNVWTCKIGWADLTDFPNGMDAPMRAAVEHAFLNLIEKEPEFIFSGWGGELTEPELAAVEDRKPSDAHYRAWLVSEHLHPIALRMLEDAWGLIANVGDIMNPPDSCTPGWSEAAVRWRDKYHEILSKIHPAGTVRLHADTIVATIDVEGGTWA